jgi:hypothetical protein
MCGKQEKEAGYSRYLLSHDKNAMTFKKQIMYIMKANTKIRSISAELDELYGKEGTQERETFRNEAYAYYTGKIIEIARKEAHMTQSELAAK